MPNPPSMFDSPRPASTAAPADNYIQPTLSHGLRIWWAFYWRTLLATILLVAAVAKILPLVAEAPAARLILRYGVYFFYYSAAFFMIAFILRKNFRDFRIALLSHRGGDGAQPLRPNFQRVARVWWTFSWRSLLYRLIATFAISFPLGWIVGFIGSSPSSAQQMLPRPVTSRPGLPGSGGQRQQRWRSSSPAFCTMTAAAANCLLAEQSWNRVPDVHVITGLHVGQPLGQIRLDRTAFGHHGKGPGHRSERPRAGTR